MADGGTRSTRERVVRLRAPTGLIKYEKLTIDYLLRGSFWRVLR